MSRQREFVKLLKEKKTIDDISLIWKNISFVHALEKAKMIKTKREIAQAGEIKC